MNKREKEVIQSQLETEKAVLNSLESQYKRALNDIINKTKILQADIDMLQAAGDADDATLSMVRSKVYQKQYQEALKAQVEGILDKLHSDNYSTIQGYLNGCYEEGYVGTMYSIAGQGIPIIMPIDQSSVVKAVQLDSKISTKTNTRVGALYNALGVDDLKKKISNEVSRGIATSISWADMARNLNNAAGTGLSNATRIARTEGHRIQQTASDDARQAAKSKGADVVKQWDASLDGRTRDTHRKLDGQIREVDEPFEADGKKAMFPGQFGDPSEDCNCRCVALTRAKWALDDAELQTLKDRAEYFGIDKTKDFDDFKSNYLKSAELTRKADEAHRKIGGSGQQIIDKPTYQKLTKDFLKHDGVIVRGKEAENHLGKLAYASYLPSLNSAFIRDDATVSDVIEEMYHAEQDRKNLFGDILTKEVFLRREIDAQEHLLSMTERYKIPIEEVELTRHNLEEYKIDLERLLKEGDSK